ncbi:MAG: proton-conducting transporter membrane subunit, partial [Rhodospirillaceae bacterium]
MGGIWRLIPFTFAVMVIGNLALTGIPPLSGYFSKDMVIEAAHAAHTGVGTYAFTLGIAAALLTSFYSWRLTFLTFFGTPRADKKTMDHVHESPYVMTVPLAGLALGAVFAGMIGYSTFVGEGRQDFWRDAIMVFSSQDSIGEVLENHPAFYIKYLPLFVSLVGLGTAYLMYIRHPELPGKLAAMFPGVYKFLLNKWYFDELYNFILVKNAFRFGRWFWKGGDTHVIDGYGPDGISAATIRAAKRISAVQS